MNNQHGPVRMLIVDDTPTHVALIRRLLQEAGYEVEVRGVAAEALRLARRWRPAFILLDLGIPLRSRTEPLAGDDGLVDQQVTEHGKSGGEVLLEALRADPDLAQTGVIILTVRGDPDLEMRLQDERARYLTKGCNADQVLTELGRWLRQEDEPSGVHDVTVDLQRVTPRTSEPRARR